jgi:glycine oxidase
MEADNYGSPMRAERAASGRRPSEPDPGNAGAGMVARNRPPDERTPSVPQNDHSADGRRGTVVSIGRRRGGSAGENALDLVVVGAGVVGLACAWRAARRGVRVRVLERDEPGAGASGVAAGMLAPVGEATWGEERLLDLARSSARAWPGFAGELAEDSGLESGYDQLGALHVALDRDETEELRRRFDLMRSLELPAEWLRPSECRAMEGGLAPACAGGIHAPDEAAVDPVGLLAALEAALVARGGEIVRGAEVIEPLIAGERLTGVQTADGVEHAGRAVLLAAGAWSGTARWLPPPARPPVRPVKGQVLTLRSQPTQPVCERIVASERVYLVPRADGRLIVGATVEERGFDRNVTAGGVYELLREAYRALPEVAELELVSSAAGLRPGTPDNAPLIGRGGIDGLLLATGHWRNGVLLAPITAAAIAALVAGETPPSEIAVAHPGRFAGSAGPELALAPATEEEPK